MSDRPPGSSRGAPSGSPAGSKSGSKAGSQAGSSKSGAPSKSSGKAPETQKVDPAATRKPLSEAEILGKRFDLPPDAYIKVSRFEFLLKSLAFSLTYFSGQRKDSVDGPT